MSRHSRRRLAKHPSDEVGADDVVIDLTEQLAPYHGTDLRAVKRKAPPPPQESQEPQLWTPLKLDFLNQPPRAPQD